MAAAAIRGLPRPRTPVEDLTSALASGVGIHHTPYPQQISRQYPLDFFLAVAPGEEPRDQMGVRRHVPHADGERIPYPVEVRADADGINAGNTGHIVDVVQNMLQGRPEIGVFRSVGVPPGLRRFAIPGFAAFP